MKKLLLTVVLIIALAGGCNMYASIEEQEKEFKQRIAEASDYIHNKYGDDFTFVEYDLPDYNRNNAKIEYYSSIMDPDHEYFNVFIHENDGVIEYGDDYFEYLIRDEMENVIRRFFAKEFGDNVKAYIRITHTEFDKSLTNENSLSDLYELYPDYSIWTDVFISDTENMSGEEFRIKMERVEKELKRSGKAYVVYVYLISTDQYNKLERYGWTEIMNAFKREWKPDGDIVRNEYDAVIRNGEVK